MSGDVQPRKRKDKKKKKDDLGIEEPRGTAAALGEGDIFMHSYQEHGTGGHWCAKVIFFSLLAVLVTLIGLIILENRGVSDLEAKSVESRYAGVLEGWLEEGHSDDHHDEHTLELNHHDDEDDDDHGGELDHDDEELEHDDDEEIGHDDEDEEDENEEHDVDDDENQEDDDEQDEINQDGNDDEDSQEANDDDEQNDDSEEQNLETAEDEDEVEEPNYRRYYQSSQNQANDDDDDDDLQNVDDNDDESAQNDDEYNQQDDEDNDDSQENNDDDDDEQNEIDDTNEEHDNENSDENNQDNEDEDDHDDHQDESSEVELEHIEDEVIDDVSTEAPAQEPNDKSDEEDSNEANPVDDANDDDVEFLEPDDDDDDDLPEVLPIPVPKGKPLAEMEDTSSTEKPQDTLADEEEYEREQEALRREKEQTSQGMWLKLVVGGALLVATQAVLRRATAPRDTEDEVDTTREETPLSDRRMTLIAEPVAPPPVTKPQEVSQPVGQREVVKQAPVVKSAPPPPPEDEDEEMEEEEEEIVVAKDVELVAATKDAIDQELYSDEEEAEDEEEEEEIVEEKKEPPKPTPSKPTVLFKEIPKPTPSKQSAKPIEKKEAPKPVQKEPTPEEDDDDVEIIEDEDFGEELEEEEEISDVDDAELLTRLDAKYGRLPESEIPGTKKDGGNSIEDDWPGEPSDAYWRDELDNAERDYRQGEWTAALERASAAKLHSSARARYIIARALDSAAEAKRDNGLLTKAIAAYLELLKMSEQLSDKKLLEVTDRALNRIKFRGNYLGAEPIYRLLIRRFPDDPTHRNNLTVSFLMANRVDLAEEAIKETLKRWPNDRIALAHHGFILKTLHNKLEEAVDAFTKALEGDKGPANESRFYYHLGDSLLLLGRFTEAEEVHKRGAKLGHFLSPAQRSLYNVDRLKSKPWWNLDKTPYTRMARALEMSWKEILKEGLAAHALYEKEKEGLKERGEWSQLDLFVRGREVPNRCARAPVTCSIVRSEAAAAGCRRGQVKFSSMEAGTHVRPHVGPTNCRLRMHLGLSNTKDTYIRVDQETRQWQTGKVLMFDDSFEHEVWHNGTGTRLVLIVDVWHPDLTPSERRQLPAI